MLRVNSLASNFFIADYKLARIPSQCPLGHLKGLMAISPDSVWWLCREAPPRLLLG